MKPFIKSLIILTFFLVATPRVQSQTKEETIDWLTEKMKKPNFFKMDSYTYSDVSAVIDNIKFEENFLTIRGTFKYDDMKYGTSDKVVASTRKDFIYKINLADLKEGYLASYGAFGTNSNSIYYYNYWEKMGYKHGEWQLIDFESKDVFVSNTSLIQVNSNIETDIRERFAKAIKHYQSLMTIKKSDEKF